MSDVYMRLPDDLHEAIKKSGKRNRRSMNGEIVRAIEYYLNNAPEAHYDATGKQTEEVKAKTE